jgi:hypothetical protein
LNASWIRPKKDGRAAARGAPVRPERKLTSVGMIVRDSRYDAITEKPTASAIGVKRYFAAPSRKTTETKTIVIDRVADERRHGDLLSAVEDRADQRLPLSQVPVDVLDLDGRVVHQDADREREASEGHDVDGLSQGLEGDERGQDRQRDRDGDDERAPPGAQEEEDHARR